MWYLTSEPGKRIIYLSSEKNKVTFGRSPDRNLCDVCLPDDASISRKHASIYYRDGKIFLKDLGSKYGTFVNNLSKNDSGVEAQVEVELHDKDMVRFGVLNSVWHVTRPNFVSCASTLKGENLEILKKYLLQLGGTYKNEWDQTCTHLTMPAITLTIKVVLALVQGANIVNIDFWIKCCEAAACGTNLPDPKDFTPKILESTLNKEKVSFMPDVRRSKIFSGKKFIFFSKRQMEMYKDVLASGSGSAMLLSQCKITKSMLSTPNVIVIQYIINNTTQESQNQQNQINDIVNYLKSKGKRVVADAEIGLAILYNSVEKYCNPNFNFSTEIVKESDTKQSSTKASNVLAPESQDSAMNVDEVKNVCVDETLASTNEDQKVEGGHKRKIDEVVERTEGNDPKKLATGNNMPNANDDGLFNFIEDNVCNKEESAKERLNFSKPVKRKQDFSDGDDDNLFNFISPEEKTDASSSVTNTNLFNQAIKQEPNGYSPQIKRTKLEDSQDTHKDFSVLIGASAKTIVENNSSTWKSTLDIIPEPIIKKEEDITDEIEKKINSLDLGTTLVTVNKNLITESKLPLLNTAHSGQVNFKTFKKVWPIRTQVTPMHHKFTVVKPDTSILVDIESSDTDDDIITTKLTVPKRKTLKINDYLNNFNPE